MRRGTFLDDSAQVVCECTWNEQSALRDCIRSTAVFRSISRRTERTIDDSLPPSEDDFFVEPDRLRPACGEETSTAERRRSRQSAPVKKSVTLLAEKKWCLSNGARRGSKTW
jgi:hypothetical protein